MREAYADIAIDSPYLKKLALYRNFLRKQELLCYNRYYDWNVSESL